MSTDAGSPIQPRAPFSIALPRIRDLRMRRIPFEAPTLEHFESLLSRYREAVEFLITTDGPVPVRAYGPALFVGDVEVNHSERVDATTWRLLFFEPALLRTGAPISWGWMKDPKGARQSTQFRYEGESGKPTAR